MGNSRQQKHHKNNQNHSSSHNRTKTNQRSNTNSRTNSRTNNRTNNRNSSRIQRQKQRRKKVIQERILLVVLLVAVAAVIIGVAVKTASCKKQKKSQPVESQIQLQEDGSLRVTYVEDFAESYYDKEELQEQIKEEIATYNNTEASISEAITLEDFYVKDKKATLVLRFANETEYTNYYNTFMYEDGEGEFLIGTSDLVEEKGHMLVDLLKRAEDDSTISRQDISESNYKVIYTNTEASICLEKGKILYVSKKVKMESGLAKTVDGEDNYIIYSEE